MKLIFRYLKEYKRETIIAPSFKLFEALLDLFIPIIVMSMINTGISEKNGTHIAVMGVLMVVLGAMGLASSIIAQFYAAKAAVGISARMREDLFTHINKLSYTELDTIGTATLINRINVDINQVQTGINMTLRLLLRSPFIVLGAIICAMVVDFKAGLCAFLLVPLLGIAIYFIMKKTIPMYKDVQGKLDIVTTASRENLVGVRVVRAFCRQKEEKEEFTQKANTLYKALMKVGALAATINPFSLIVINIGIAGVLIIGGNEVGSGAMKAGAVVALVNYFSQIIIELVKLADLVIIITRSLACADRLQEVFDEVPSVKQEHQFMVATVPGAPKIEFKDVSFTYKNAAKPSLENVSIKIYHGETIGVIGSTGSGKSTFGQLIPRFYDATEGTVLVDGRNVKEYSFGQLRNKIGVVPQKAVLFKGTIRDNMKWGMAAASDNEIFAALEVAQARDFVEKKPGKLDFLVEQGGRNFSGGQRQRLTIARALLKKPEILILDDSSSALDYATDAKLREALEYKTQGATTIIIAQRIASVRHADRIIVFEEGKVAGIGNHDDLLKTCDVYREICATQLGKEA
jgi:ABC-type multidrug transport system fused ATPase/permease subunit